MRLLSEKRFFALGAVFLAIGILIGAFFVFEEKGPSDMLTLYGNVDVRLVDIGFRVSGRVERLLYEEGDFVEKGNLMALLEKTPYDSQAAQAEANLASVKANLENAEILLKRRLELIGIGGVSQEDVDNATAMRDERLADYYAAEAALQSAIDNLAYTEVYAPTDGIILSRIREPGTAVNPTDPVFTLSVSSPVWIRAFVCEPDLGLI